MAVWRFGMDVVSTPSPGGVGYEGGSTMNDEHRQDRLAVDGLSTEDRAEPEGHARRSRRRWPTVVMLVAVLAMVVPLSTSFLGRNGSSKFSAVGSAIGGGEGGGIGGGGRTFERSSTPLAPVPSQVAADATPAVAASADLATLEKSQSLTAGRSFVSTATMTVRTDDLGGTKQLAIAAVEAVGGGLFGESSSFNGDAKATLTFKVPPESFRRLLTELEGHGELVSQEVKTDDVTQQVVDLDAWIWAATASLNRTKELLDKATSLSEINSLDAEVARRQGDLEKLRGQQRTLAERTGLATIVLTLVKEQPTAVAPVVPPVVKPSVTPGFSDGLTAGWKAFTDAGSVVLAVVGAVLPFMLVVVPVLVLAWLLLRRRDRKAGFGPSGPAMATP